MEKHNNRLSLETSPYLLQHSHNPVDWYPWGDEALSKAKAENKLLLISVGYSSCHWCHVMERETFSNPAIADVMNRYFVNIKVDREERPDIDQIYMNAVQIITRSGGWPLNCFALPDGRPVFGGTYYKSDQWLNVLESLAATWQNDPSRVLEVAEELTMGVSTSELITTKREVKPFDQSAIHIYVDKWKKQFDNHFGGSKGAPKFPMPGSLLFLLRYGNLAGDEQVLCYVNNTLNRMASGGIYDHLGGGFSRYSVDERWLVPHFEKMLYDNAQLVSLYSQAYKKELNPVYERVVAHTIGFMLRELKAKTGGFYSSLDADSEGKEGAYYTFTKQQVDELLGDDSEVFSVAYGVSAAGTINGTNVLNKCASSSQISSLFSKSKEEVAQIIEQSLTVLFAHRESRPKPSTDTKILTSWNALAINAFVDAYIAFGNDSYLREAIECANFLIENAIDEEFNVNRSYCAGKSCVSGFLDDYGFTANSFLYLYRVTFDTKWLTYSKKLVDRMVDLFYHSASGMFYYASSKSKQLIVRKMELMDGVIPSSSSVAAQVLLDIGRIQNSPTYVDMASQMVANISDQLTYAGPYVYSWADCAVKLLLPVASLHVASQGGNSVYNEVLKQSLYPNIYPHAELEKKGNELQLCTGNTCGEPITSVDNVVKELSRVWMGK